MKTFSTSGTGNQQTLSEIESDKIPIYDSITDAEADLSNLTEGQIGATKDEGSELSAPVDVVESGNLHAVSSNAVAEQTVRNTYMDCFHFDGNRTQAQLYELLTSKGIINDTDNTTICVVGNVNGESFNNILQSNNVRYLRRDSNNIYNISKTSTTSVNAPINIIYLKLS